MKKLIRAAIVMGMCLLLGVFSSTITHAVQSPPSLRHTTGAALFLQITPSPQPEVDHSEVGSTDGIMIMGGVIALIVIVPILLKRKSWARFE